MLKYFVDGNSRFHISVKHCANEVNAIFAHDVWNPKIAVHDFVDTVERILLVDNGVEKNALLCGRDAETPDLSCIQSFCSGLLEYLVNARHG